MADRFGRPNWDDYFMALNFILKTRSLDPSTQHGSLVFDDQHSILSTGYNGPPRGSIDENVPLTRPEKYDFMIHAEEGCIHNAARKGIKLEGANISISGRPCNICLRAIRSVGIKKVIYGPVQSHMLSPKDLEIQKQLLVGSGIEIEEYKGDGFVDVLLDALFEAEKCGIDVKSKIKERFYCS